MLDNVLAIDFESMRVSLKHERGMLVLFDFEAAFPFMSHQFMWECLSHASVPSSILNLIKCLYHNNSHMLRLKGEVFPSLTASNGVRQGCPLSPVLFVLCIDVLLRCLKRLVAQSLINAYADDNAMVVPYFPRDANTIIGIYRAFGDISGWKLNLPKTILIPLWPGSLKSIKCTLLNDDLPAWSHATVASHHKCLVFVVLALVVLGRSGAQP